MAEKRNTAESPRENGAIEEKEGASGDKLENLTLEQGFQKLDELVDRLEDREISLEESFQAYKQGMELLKYCSGKIDTVEKKMLQVSENGEFSEF